MNTDCDDEVTHFLLATGTKTQLSGVCIECEEAWQFFKNLVLSLSTERVTVLVPELQAHSIVELWKHLSYRILSYKSGHIVYHVFLVQDRRFTRILGF